MVTATRLPASETDHHKRPRQRCRSAATSSAQRRRAIRGAVFVIVHSYSSTEAKLVIAGLRSTPAARLQAGAAPRPGGEVVASASQGRNCAIVAAPAALAHRPARAWGRQRSAHRRRRARSWLARTVVCSADLPAGRHPRAGLVAEPGHQGYRPGRCGVGARHRRDGTTRLAARPESPATDKVCIITTNGTAEAGVACPDQRRGGLRLGYRQRGPRSPAVRAAARQLA